MPATIFSGSKVKTLKNTLTLNGNMDIVYASSDPTSVAVDAPEGSIIAYGPKLYRKLTSGSNTDVVELGAGAGGINYVENSDFETNVTGWATYADAAGTSPVDGTGGSPTVTFTRTTSSPLRGTGSGLITKDAANRQGEGISYDFTIDSADQAKVLRISADVNIASGTYADNDVTFWIYDKTNAVLIQPVPYQLLNSTLTQTWTGEFQTASNSTSYRLIAHVSSTSASAYTIKLDNVSVGPKDVARGPVVTDWQTLSGLTVVNASGSLSNVMSRWVGDSVNIRGLYAFSGGASGGLTITMPSSLTIDTTKHAATQIPVGYADGYDDNTNGRYTGLINVASATTLYIAGPNTTGIWTTAVPFTWAASDQLEFNFTVPIAGKSSNQTLSSDQGARLVAFNYKKSNTSLTNSYSTVVYNTAVSGDTTGSYNSSTGVYTVPEKGWYRVSAGISFGGQTWGAGSVVGMTLYKNSSDIFETFGSPSGAADTSAVAKSANATWTILCSAGDTLAIRGKQTQTGSGIALDNDVANFLSIEKISSPQQIAASESVNARVTGGTMSGTVGANFAGSTTINWGTASFDSHNIHSAGSFTLPMSGKYQINAHAWITGTEASNNFVALGVAKDGSLDVFQLARVEAASLSSTPISLNTLISGTSGQVITFRAWSDMTSPALTNDSAGNFVTITRVGN